MSQKRVAVVTGSSSGFGLLTVVELAKAGYSVIATMRQPERRARLDQALGGDLAAHVEVRQLDVTDFAGIPATIDHIARDHGRIDVLINNAGFAVGGFAEDVALDELRLQMDTNFFGQVAVTRAVLPAMRAQRSGHIIMVSSILGLIGQPMVSSYCASKHALEGWAESLRIELRALGVKVVLIEPGAYKTDIWTRNVMISRGATDGSSPNKERSRKFADGVKESSGRMADPIDVARLIARIAEDPNPRLRYLSGRDAKIGYFLRSVVPWNLWEGMVEKQSKIR